MKEPKQCATQMEADLVLCQRQTLMTLYSHFTTFKQEVFEAKRQLGILFLMNRCCLRRLDTLWACSRFPSRMNVGRVGRAELIKQKRQPENFCSSKNERNKIISCFWIRSRTQIPFGDTFLSKTCYTALSCNWCKGKMRSTKTGDLKVFCFFFILTMLEIGEQIFHPVWEEIEGSYDPNLKIKLTVSFLLFQS